MEIHSQQKFTIKTISAHIDYFLWAMKNATFPNPIMSFTDECQEVRKFILRDASNIDDIFVLPRLPVVDKPSLHNLRKTNTKSKKILGTWIQAFLKIFPKIINDFCSHLPHQQNMKNVKICNCIEGVILLSHRKKRFSLDSPVLPFPARWHSWLIFHAWLNFYDHFSITRIMYACLSTLSVMINKRFYSLSHSLLFPPRLHMYDQTWHFPKSTMPD